MRLALFDFDGTITKKDSLIDFLIYLKGWPAFLSGIVLFSPLLIAWKTGLISTWKIKEALYNHFFGGISEATFNEKGKQYLPRLEKMIFAAALEKIKAYQLQGDQVVVVTASSAAWVRPWCEKYSVDLICTRLVIKDGYLTGEIDGKNCNGKEKVTRIKQQYQLDQYTSIAAYGNSSGDKAMLELADEKFYRCFQ